MKIIVLTSGGDSPGMNPAVRAVVRSGIYRGAEVYVSKNGYDGLMTGGKNITRFSWNDVGGIINVGGTILGTARSMEFMLPEGRKKAIQTLLELGINKMVIIGGDGSLTGATKLHAEWKGVVESILESFIASGEKPEWFQNHWADNIQEMKVLRIVGLVGSIDNDMADTSMTIGCDSALTRICDAVDSISTTASSHQREFVVEVMGRNCGWLALHAAATTGADYLFVPEYPSPVDWRTIMAQSILEGKANGRRSSIVIIAEGAHDENLVPISSADVKQALDNVGCDCRITILGHVQRGGSPSFYDRTMSLMVGNYAVDQLYTDEATFDPLIVCVNGLYELQTRKIADCLKKSAEIVKLIKQKDFQSALALRGDAFSRVYHATTKLMKIRPDPNRIKHNCNVGIIHIGACSPGMNATVRATVRLLDDYGYNIYVIRQGLYGFPSNSIQRYYWMDVNGWAPTGGAKLGTSRYIPGEFKWEDIAQRLEEYSINFLLVIGGLDGYDFAYDIKQQKANYPIFRSLNVIVVPCSISNNIAGTQYSIGSDTALNSVIDAVDKIKQSAMAHRRVFVIEVLGGKCGFLALLGALATGAEKTYIHEKEISLLSLQADLDFLSHTFDGKKEMALVMISEKASSVFSTHFISKLFQEKSKKKYDVRVALLGHLQQGGNPSPIDRVLSLDIAQFCVRYLDELFTSNQNNNNGGNGEVEGCCLCSGFLPNGDLHMLTIEEFRSLMDLKHRRPANQWWIDSFYNMAEKYAQFSQD